MPPVGRRKRAPPLPNVCRNRRRPCVADPSDGTAPEPRIGIVTDLVNIAVIRFHNELVDFVIIVAVFWGIMDQHLTNAFTLFPGEILRQCFPELFRREFSLFKHQFFDCSKRICQIGNADLQSADKVIYRAALLERKPSADAVFTQSRTQNIRHVFFQHHVTGVLNDHTVACKITDDHVPRMFKLIVGVHLSEMAHTFYQLRSRLRIDAVIHGNEK